MSPDTEESRRYVAIYNNERYVIDIINDDVICCVVVPEASSSPHATILKVRDTATSEQKIISKFPDEFSDENEEISHERVKSWTIASLIGILVAEQLLDLLNNENDDGLSDDLLDGEDEY